MYETPELFIVFPTTYMNLVGLAVRENSAELEAGFIAVFDEVNLPVGKCKAKNEGGENSSHNGLKSFARFYGSYSFPRIKFGVGPPRRPLREFVLSEFSEAEMKVLRGLFDVVGELVERWAYDGNWGKLMTEINSIGRG